MTERPVTSDADYDQWAEQQAIAAKEEPRVCVSCKGPARAYGEGLMPCRWCGVLVHQLQDSGQTACWERHKEQVHVPQAMGLPARTPAEQPMMDETIRPIPPELVPSRNVQGRVTAQKGEPVPDRPPLGLDAWEREAEDLSMTPTHILNQRVRLLIGALRQAQTANDIYANSLIETAAERENFRYRLRQAREALRQAQAHIERIILDNEDLQ